MLSTVGVKQFNCRRCSCSDHTQYISQCPSIYSNSSRIDCQPCPIGAVCPNNQLRASRDYWAPEAHTSFTRCPAGFCCANISRNGIDQGCTMSPYICIVWQLPPWLQYCSERPGLCERQ
jgi:hypothetical protein